MDALLQFTVNGILIGGVYSLIALGIVLIYKSSRIFNFAAGEMVMVGAFFMWTLLDLLGLPLIVSLLLTMLFTGLVGWIMERLAIHPLIGQPLLSAILVTLGLADILRGLAMLFWGGASEKLSEFLPGKPVFIGNVVLPVDLLWCFGISIAIFGALLLFYQKTSVGLAMRAVAEDHQVAQARGISVGKIFAIVWFITGIIAATGGILLSYRVGVTQFVGLISLKAFPAVLLGGLDSIGGALVGGIIVGLLENLAGGLIAPWLMETTPYIVLIFVLLIRPDGLFGLKRIERI
ncbi:MAG: branched-chain amino acid ABC transporter permease [Deltaproteobacteria bacterium]|nr:branched-chain amino acid ABC transporter permease [Deltaproteobacteria bacterium]